MWYKILDRMDVFVETDTWLWIEVGMMICTIIVGIIWRKIIERE